MAGKVVCVAGPTGCGKTRLGVLLAQRFGGEVVSADSMQIYRGMEIGSAAPAPEEQQGVPHHLLGVADPAESWSVSRYVEAAVPVIDDILARGKLPLLVGGTGLWMEAAVRGTVFPPGQAGGAVRKELEGQLAAEGVEPLLAELSRVDPASAARLHPSDTKRILRALEVWRETGQPLSALNAEERRRPPRYEATWLGLTFRDRGELRRRISARADAMAEAGLLEEVRALAASVPRNATAFQAIGYKELLPVLDGQRSLAEGMAEVKLRTGQFAKRQMSWFRRNPAIHWLVWEDVQDFPTALQISTNILTGSGVC